MLKTVIFDMDGVIVNTEPLHHKAYYKMFADVNINVSNELYESFTGQSTINICRRLVDHFNLKEHPETLVKLKRQHFKYLFENDESLALINGVLDAIKEYHNKGLTLVLASSASMPNINRIFERFKLNPYFISKFSGADLAQSKPHPEIFLKAVEASGNLASECIVIEDSTNGMKASNEANVFCVGYHGDSNSKQNFGLCDYEAFSFSELTFQKLSSLLA
ncbi:HAD family phosphatase [Winogradskyella maritima]|uniref:HAD family hydrolase n=1 Tax=Winogradskyella maritima TaxID=1517766 RepID=A0ABV8AN20_9FLAO|nr:HAD family phosphatase [Winogradskyella maritima]